MYITILHSIHGLLLLHLRNFFPLPSVLKVLVLQSLQTRAMTVKLFRVRAEGTRIHKKGVQSVATRVKCIREKKCQWRGKIDETICSFFSSWSTVWILGVITGPFYVGRKTALEFKLNLASFIWYLRVSASLCSYCTKRLWNFLTKKKERRINVEGDYSQAKKLHAAFLVAKRKVVFNEP